MQRFRDQLIADPSLYPQKLDPVSQRVLLLRLSPGDYAQASFLDDRILAPTNQVIWVGLEDLSKALLGVAPARPLHFIFHAGHVGSTLLSRLLDGADGVLGLREPLPLRTIAEALDVLNSPESLFSPKQFEALLRDFCLLWARGFPDTSTSIVKATSATARLGPELLRACPTARAVHLHLSIEPYLATLLAGENSPLDLRGHASERMRRLIRFGVKPPTPVHAMSIGELAAMSWAVERLTERALADAGGERLLSIDFEQLLAAPEPTLRRVCAHLRLNAPEHFFTDTMSNPVWRRYAKAPEHAYSPHDRAQILAQARVEMREEIRRGLAWVDEIERLWGDVPALRVTDRP